MSKFSHVPSFQSAKLTNVAEEQLLGVCAPAANTKTSPLIFLTDQHPETTTGQLPDISNSYQFLTSEQLGAISDALDSTSTTGGILKIPGVRKHERNTEELVNPSRRMNPRLRLGIILATTLFVMMTTLLSLTPLANGQSSIPLINGISNWVHTEQTSWLFPSLLISTTQGTTSTAVQGNPPPMTLPSSSYVAMAQQAAINAGISPVYFVRQINQESGFNPNASSYAGAQGIAQFEPGTAAGLGIDPWNPYQALNGAARLMASYAKNYGGDYAMALAAYNGGPGAVQYAVGNCGNANWMNCLPGETRNYISVIMGI